jgi:molybdopterin synthase catalytic subunit
MIDIREDGFNVDEMIKSLKTSETGAVVTFIGTVRNDENVEGLDFECYKDMALKELEGLKQSAVTKFHLNDVGIIHRVGKLSLGEDIVLIAVSAGHRDEAFTACRYLIDELKKIVPIWKKEILKEQ